MKTLFLDTFSGISGDMMLGLLIDLGVDPDQLKAELGKLHVSGYRLELSRDKRHGIGGTRVKVICDGRQPPRNWQNIDDLISKSALETSIKESARNIFRRLGEAEAHVHKTTLVKVHFHEVGAVDAIVDIVGTVIGLHLLEVQAIVCAPLPMSSGMIKGSHGTMPLPAPATLQILNGHTVRDANSDKELVTPTGAAIAATLASFGTMPEMTITKIGYGVGGWDLEDRPNLLRGILGDSVSSEGFTSDQVTVIETHIDDSSPEWLGSLLDTLIDQGALDAGYTSLQMKKNRPGVLLTAIARPDDAARLAKTILRESSAIGVRMYETRRMKLRREPAVISTVLGVVEIKLIYEGETLLRITPEHASCVKLAAESKRPLPEVYRLVTSAANLEYGLEDGCVS